MTLIERSANTSLIFLDACRDNPLASSLARSMGATRSYAVGRGLALVQTGKESLIAFATEPGEVALDGKGEHSPFTSALLEHIDTPGLELSALLRRVGKKVREETNEQQVPWTHSSLTEDFYFAGSTDSVSEALPGPGGSESEEPMPAPQKTAKTLQLTPDLGSSPRVSGTLVPDGIVPSGWDTITGRTILAEPGYIGVSGPMTFRTPDGRETSKQRAFLTFGLEPVPDDAEITGARLQIRIGGLSGNPVFERNILVERVKIGAELEVSDYAKGGVLEGTENVGHIQSPGIEVRRAVQAAINEGSGTLTLRIRFQYEYHDGYFNSSTGGLLVIEYLN